MCTSVVVVAVAIEAVEVVAFPVQTVSIVALDIEALVVIERDGGRAGVDRRQATVTHPIEVAIRAWLGVLTDVADVSLHAGQDATG